MGPRTLWTHWGLFVFPYMSILPQHRRDVCDGNQVLDTAWVFCCPSYCPPCANRKSDRLVK